MSEAVKQWREDRTTHWFSAALARGLADVLIALDASGKAAALEFSPSDPTPESWDSWEDPVWLSSHWKLGAGEEVRIGAAAATVKALAELAHPGDPSEEEVTATFTEVIGQAAAAAAGAAGTRISKEAVCSELTPAEAPSDRDSAIELRFEIEGAAHVVAAVPNEQMLAEMFPGIEAFASGGSEGLPAPTPGTAVSEAALGGVLDEDLPEIARRNLQMLMGVEMQVSVSFGRTRLALEDVLKLASGSIVELNRSATDPVEVMVNDSVVARGEVVVIDGNYGIRVTEVTSKKERIQSIF